MQKLLKCRLKQVNCYLVRKTRKKGGMKGRSKRRKAENKVMEMYLNISVITMHLKRQNDSIERLQSKQNLEMYCVLETYFKNKGLDDKSLGTIRRSKSCSNLNGGSLI